MRCKHTLTTRTLLEASVSSEERRVFHARNGQGAIGIPSDLAGHLGHLLELGTRQSDTQVSLDLPLHDQFLENGLCLLRWSRVVHMLNGADLLQFLERNLGHTCCPGIGIEEILIVEDLIFLDSFGDPVLRIAGTFCCLEGRHLGFQRSELRLLRGQHGLDEVRLILDLLLNGMLLHLLLWLRLSIHLLHHRRDLLLHLPLKLLGCLLRYLRILERLRHLCLLRLLNSA